MDEPSAELIDLFTNSQFDRQLFDRIRGVINARLIDGRLFLEIFADGCTLPPAWINTITCTVTDPLNGWRSQARLAEVMRQEDGHILAKTEPLDPGLTDPDSLSDRTVVRLSSRCGRSTERPLRPLLLAKPQP